MSSQTGSDAFLAQLGTYQRLVEDDLAQTCNKLQAQAKVFGNNGQRTAQLFAAILVRRAKRLRGALVLVGYQMCGGKDLQDVLPAARAIEMLQTYLLITDDVYDQSATRRGGPSAHAEAEKLHQTLSLRGEGWRFGESLAGCSALVGCHAAIQTILESDMNASVKVGVLDAINRAMTITVYGQANDLFNEARSDVSTAQVRNTLIWKTAYYTFVGPLVAGALAAGAGKNANLHVLHQYGERMGLAFQAADDLLGTFGNPEVSGKSDQDDIRDGKVTLLVAHVRDHATPAVWQEFASYLGKPNLTPADFAACKLIMRQTGAVEFVRDLARKEAERAVQALDNAPEDWGKEQLAFLRELAEYVVNREG